LLEIANQLVRLNAPEDGNAQIGDEDGTAPGVYFFRCLRQRFAAGSAIAMNGHGGNAFGDPGAQGDDARDVGGIRRLRNAAEDDFIHERGVQPGAREQRVYGDAAKVLGAAMRKVRAGLAKGRADAVHDNEPLSIHALTSSGCD